MTASKFENQTDYGKSDPVYSLFKLFKQISIFILKTCGLCLGLSILIVFTLDWYFSSIFVFIFLLLSAGAFVYQISDWLLYQPDQPSTSRFYVPCPSLFDLPYENLFLQTQDKVKIHAFLIKQDLAKYHRAPTVLYFHGNAGNIGHPLEHYQGLYLCGCNILSIEYRGFGKSQGVPSEKGLYLDAQCGLDYLLYHPAIDKSQIIVYGRSLGGAVAIDLARTAKYGQWIQILVVENTFTDIPSIAKVLVNVSFVHWLPDWSYKNTFQSLDKIAQVKIPTLFISGLADETVPPSMMAQLYESSGSNFKWLATFAQGKHNETCFCPNYYQAWNKFIQEISKKKELSQFDEHIPMAHVV